MKENNLSKKEIYKLKKQVLHLENKVSKIKSVINKNEIKSRRATRV